MRAMGSTGISGAFRLFSELQILKAIHQSYAQNILPVSMGKRGVIKNQINTDSY
jgi:hypothetical protein